MHSITLNGPSDSQVEATTSELLDRGVHLVDDLRLESSLSFALHLLASLLLVVLALHVLQLASQSLDLVLVLIDLSLIHVQLSSHRLHLARLLLEILLVDRQLLSDLRTRLSCKQVLQLDI